MASGRGLGGCACGNPEPAVTGPDGSYDMRLYVRSDCEAQVTVDRSKIRWTKSGYDFWPAP